MTTLPLTEEQHHDHIWLTVGGEGWAIREIERDAAGRPTRMLLWRGYVPTLEFANADVSEVDWPRYCDKAVEYLAATEPLEKLKASRRRGKSVSTGVGL